MVLETHLFPAAQRVPLGQLRPSPQSTRSRRIQQRMLPSEHVARISPELQAAYADESERSVAPLKRAIPVKRAFIVPPMCMHP